MKISKVIISTDNNPLYHHFWPIVSNAWRKIGITPVLAVVGSCDHIQLQKEDEIIRIPEIPGISNSFISQNIRLIIPTLYPEEVCIIGDIDMLPLSKRYFRKTVKAVSDDAVVIFSSDAYKESLRYPICYIAAKGKYFAEILGYRGEKDICNFIKHFYNYNLGWDTDELIFAQKLHAWTDFKSRAVLLNRGGWSPFAKDRIDRSSWSMSLKKLIINNYIDAHMRRPLDLLDGNTSLIKKYVDANLNGFLFLCLNFSLVFSIYGRRISSIKSKYVVYLKGLFENVKILRKSKKLNIQKTKSKKVVSFSLFGDNKKYCVGAVENARRMKEIYPGWVARFYVAKNISQDVMQQLLAFNAEVFVMQGQGLDYRYMLWRYLAYDDPAVEIAIFRDCDSYISEREKYAVEAWLRTDKQIHIMRDHPWHESRVMGGMFGLRKSQHINKIWLKILLEPLSNQYGVDQSFLVNEIYHNTRTLQLIHDAYKIFSDEEVLDFPSARQNCEYVGEVKLDNPYEGALNALIEAEQAMQRA